MIVKQVDDMREHYEDRITLNSEVKQEDTLAACHTQDRPLGSSLLVRSSHISNLVVPPHQTGSLYLL